MVRAVSVVGGSSSLVESKPCAACNLSGVDLISSMGRKHVAAAPSRLDLSTSFLDCSSMRVLSSPPNNLKKQRKKMSTVAVGGLGGQYEDSFEDVKRQTVDYFTYKAVRTVLNQLYEMNPPEYRWFYNYVASNERGYGKTFIRELVKDKLEIAERVMVTRLHLYGRWIKKCDHVEMYERISDQNLELMRERLIETVIWPSDDTNTEVVG
ncbi:Chaperonin-like RbcX protein [Perilla frutescens var. hirtella]|uniref:Chaperonin-like RbcX protein n=1 Tax=Perilla frutescens var. hirtella TaxID=608512 RepID=A0AAD4IYZ0_PERFH|nr:Chaperonin-like RbcX protein [Perilla frutescens var. hirtella]KAH6824158.1 Chaperonin-like RbcX protein [Perilla frutescens var. hirtella]